MKMAVLSSRWHSRLALRALGEIGCTRIPDGSVCDIDSMSNNTARCSALMRVLPSCILVAVTPSPAPSGGNTSSFSPMARPNPSGPLPWRTPLKVRSYPGRADNVCALFRFTHRRQTHDVAILASLLPVGETDREVGEILNSLQRIKCLSCVGIHRLVLLRSSSEPCRHSVKCTTAVRQRWKTRKGNRQGFRR